ncbi:MAG: permease-like cell division protein FtsX [Parcubacteria group bacterium]
MNYSFMRALKFAFQDFRRNIWLSVVTITVLILALLSVNILISFNAISEKIISSVQDKIDISVFFKPESKPAQVVDFQKKIRNLPEVKEAIYVSKDEALQEFETRHANDQEILDALKELQANPLNDALVIKAKDIDSFNKVLTYLGLPENQNIIKFQDFTDHQKIINRVNVISDKVNQFSIGLTAVFSLIAVLIVFNAIKVTIYTHREEINVMRLVGASNWFIRLPFLLESVLYGLFAIILTGVLLYVIFRATGSYISSFAETYNFSLISYYGAHFASIFSAELLAVILLSIISSGIAVGKYLRV